MLENFALLKEKITSPFLAPYLLPRPLLLVYFFFFPFLAVSQSVLDIKITADFQNKNLSTILKNIGEHHQISFYFKESDLLTQKRSIVVEEERLELVLNKLLSGTSLGFLDYRFYGVFIAPSKIIDAIYSADYYQALERTQKEGIVENENTIFIGDKNNLNPKGKAIIQGRILDETTQEPIIGATIFFPDLKLGTATDENGNFTMELALGKQELLIQYIGYQDLTRILSVYDDGNISVELNKGAVNLEEVIVKAKAADFNVGNAQIGQTNLDITSLKKLPTFLGETDVVKGLLLQPGVSTLGEGAIGFNVRGGEIDQNLVMQNEGIVFNSSHALGFYSTFNADLIKKVTLYKGSVPAQFGGRLASVLEVEMRDGDFQKFKMKGGIGPVSSRLNIEGPIIKNKSSFIAGFRSTYSNWVLHLIEVPEIQRSAVFFYDVNLNYTHRLNENNTLVFSVYSAKDDFSFNEEFGFDYSTKMGQIKYKSIFSDRLFSNLSVIVSRYESAQLDLDGTNASRLENSLNYYKIKEQLTFVSSDELKIEGGFSSILYQIKPGDIQPNSSFSQVIPKSLEREQSLESALFANVDWTISPALSVSAGLRLSYYQNFGHKTVFQYKNSALPSLETTTGTRIYDKGESIATYGSIEPRLSFRYRLNSETSLKVGYNRMSQYLNQIYNTNTATPTSQWQLSNLYIKPQRAHSFSLGYFRNFKDNLWETSAEVYFRSIDPLFDYVDFASLSVNKQIETELLSGIGRTYGIELSIKKTKGKVHGWLSYTLSKAERKVEGINQNKWFFSNLDKPNDVSFVLNFQPNQRNTLTFNFNYATGRPTTAPIASYQEENGRVIPIYSERNQVRIPDYHRLDVAYTRGRGYRVDKKFKVSWTLSVYNIYARRNAFTVFFSQEPLRNPKANRLSILGNAFPSITFNLELL